MKLNPRHDRVVIRRSQTESESPGGIILTGAEKPYEGEIVAVGAGKRLKSGAVRPLDVRKGDKVLFGKYSGTTVKIDGEDLLVMSEDDVIGVIECAA